LLPWAKVPRSAESEGIFILPQADGVVNDPGGVGRNPRRFGEKNSHRYGFGIFRPTDPATQEKGSVMNSLSLTVSLFTGALAGAPPSTEGASGEEKMAAYLALRTAEIEATYLADISTWADWEARRPALRQQYLEMLGLWPQPEKTPLQPTVTGVLEREDFLVEKLHFQSRPHLYVTGNLYRPRQVEHPLPAVLYVCGHSGRGRNGNKTAFQHHGIWFATHGYVCLIIDTLQLGEIAGLHHGTYSHHRWWWQARGYTPAGVECWNGIRALDYLVSRPEVDPERLAVTGISGGGACTFWIAAADERVKVAVPVSGLSDLTSYVSHRVINGHCDCMFLINTYRWPWASIAALVAPRPLLFCNSDQDPIFPMDGNERILERLRRIYALAGHPERVEAFVTPGGHDDKLPLRLAAYRWINRFLKGQDSEVTEPEVPPFPEEELRVFPDELPPDEINTKIDESFVPVGRPALPESPGELAAWQEGLRERLRQFCFGAWPAVPDLAFLGEGGEAGTGPVLGSQPLSGVVVTDPPLECRWRSLPGSEGSRVRWLIVLNDGESEESLPAWAQPLVGEDSVVLFSPRGVGAGAWSEEPPYYVRRSLALLGQTVDSGRVWDVWAFAERLAAADEAGTWQVAGRGQAGLIGAYAALFTPALQRITVVEPPASHREGPIFLNVLRVLDIPVALGLLAPRPLTVCGADPAAFPETVRLYQLAGAAGELRWR